jgi:hypothetical protein
MCDNKGLDFRTFLLCLDIAADFVGYTEQYFHVNQQELTDFGNGLNKLLTPLAQNTPGEGRHNHKLAIITHPETKEEIIGQL